MQSGATDEKDSFGTDGCGVEMKHIQPLKEVTGVPLVDKTLLKMNSNFLRLKPTHDTRLDLGNGKTLDLERCPRSKLRKQCIKYLGPKERENYEYIVCEGKIINNQSGDFLHTKRDSEDAKWIFVMSTEKKLYAGKKKNEQFHRSSFLAGGATLAAGRLEAKKGILKSISAYSGDYRPTDETLEAFLSYLRGNGVNLDEVETDLVLRLQIEEKKLRLLDLQARLRDEIDQQQQEIMAMPDRPYRKFVRLCERQRVELVRQVQASQKAAREKQLKSIFLWRKKLLEAHWAIRDARTARNRGVAKYHERMLREFSKHKDDDRNRRMEALKNNDVDRYREMLLEQQTNISGDAAERYEVLSSFLSQTEEYLHKLRSKITAAKNQQEVEEAAKAAAGAARLQGLSEEEVRAAAACAGEEVMIRNRFLEMNAPRDSSSVNKYYNLAHAVNEMVIRQPSLLRAGTLRDYQLVGLQWMLSLYNNKLNGILADEMGLGKTVQVMALIAYLMEFKGNYGPHLIIVPNVVMVNWKSELYKWLPSVSCIFYAGGKDYRSKLFHQVSALKFNVLVTTYEFIMYDRAKLSKIYWKYIVIDEAQRMKDRDSVLARDLDRYRCQRRLLLTGTPLQNDLKELWSLLNLLLLEVFDNKKAFHDWFSKPFQKEGPTQNAEDDWLETEKKVITIHRLHQILEPFMLRRRVEDVEGSLPPKV